MNWQAKPGDSIVDLPGTTAAELDDITKVELQSEHGQADPAARPLAAEYASRNRSRKASIGHTGASGRGRSPSCQPQSSIRRSTAGSRAITLIGTS